jgi:hypothetical protein
MNDVSTFKALLAVTCVWSLYHVCLYVYEGCPESIQSFWISREPVAWSWYNLTASRRRPYCTSVSSHYLVRLVTWQWDTVDWVCVSCDRRVYNDGTSRSVSSRQCTCPFYNYHAGFLFWQRFTSPKSVSSPTTHIWLPATSGFSLKSPLKERKFMNATVTQYTNSVNSVSLPTD